MDMSYELQVHSFEATGKEAIIEELLEDFKVNIASPQASCVDRRSESASVGVNVGFVSTKQ